MYNLLPILYILIGISIFAIIILRPRWFWRILIFTSVGTVGLVMFPRSIYPLCLVDEYFLGCIILGALFVIAIGRVNKKIKDKNVFNELHRFIFSLLIYYMLFQSIRGLLIWQNWTLWRWVVFYVMIGLLFLIISKYDFYVPNTKKISFIILWSAFFYFIVYLIHGLYNKIVLGLSYTRLDIQGFEWAGSTYAVFPLLIAMPAAIFVFKYCSFRNQLLAWGVVAIGLIIGNFYDSRSAWVIIMAFLLISISNLKIKNIVVWIIIFSCFACSFFPGVVIETLEIFIQSAFLSSPGESGRLMMLNASFNAIVDNPLTLFFGYGIHSHHFIIASYLQDIGYSAFRDTTSYVRLSGLAGMLIDIGLFGIFLLFLNFIFTARKIFMQKYSYGRFVLLLAIFIPLPWLIISKIEDIVLFWFMIMPFGLLLQLNRNKKRILPSEKFI